ncbi:MAG: G5 domain-containing protein [Clostridia bacterium]|nr:G5 domain-containing protein [Clostridia bacterium]
METDKKLSIKIIRKIVFVCIILISLFTVGVFASRSNLTDVTIVFADDTEISVMTSNVKVSDILDENHILLLPDEVVEPNLDSNIDIARKIIISKAKDEKVVVAEDVKSVSTEEILGKYVTITEKIITEQVEIPFETVTKDVSREGTETTDRVLQAGKNGLKEIKYRAKFQDEVEIERTVISENVIKEPVDKIIQISTKISSRSAIRNNSTTPAMLSASVEGVQGRAVTLNASAYTAATCGKAPGSPGYGITSSGAAAKSYYTVAAGGAYPIGTVVYIPYFQNAPNGGWFVVQDRGGAISNNRIDIYFDSIGECRQFGRRNLECYVYN